MFYYLHLTRPPPEHADPSRPLLIMPNIANDLRTKYPSPGPSGIDIFYAWVKCIDPSQHLEDENHGSGKRRALGPMTQLQKLTTWTGNSYKEVQVFPPKQSQGSRWQLLLCTRSTPNSFVTSIDLSAATDKFGEHVFPILSSPVLFRSERTRPNDTKPKGRETEKIQKQLRNERVFRLPSSLWGIDSVGPLRLMEHLSYDLDKKKVWDSGVALSHYLVSTMTIVSRNDSEYSDLEVPSIIKDLMRSKRATIVELGTGTGLVSIVLATLLSHFPDQPESTIIATDLPSAMEILETNLSDNGSCYPSVQAKPAILDWDDEKLSEIQNGADFIIMADVTYNTASFPSLIRTLSRLSCLRQHPSGGPAVLLAYKERDPDERRLWNMAREIGLHLNEIGRVPGAGGMPVEIYAGTFQQSG